MTRKIFLIFTLLAFSTNVSAAEEKEPIEELNAQVNYSVGHKLGEDLKQQGIEVRIEALTQGVKDALEETKPRLSPQEMRETLAELQKIVLANQEQERKELGKKNLAKAEAFLHENGQKEGVKTMPSGLQYAIIESGTGPKPEQNDKVTVHYRGTLLDGTEFDSSIARGKPATFALLGVIKGWQETLQMMRQGAKWKIFVPPDLAYGEKGAGDTIEPNSALIFEIELLNVIKKAPH